MNRGFGRIEDILLRTFLSEPNRSFTVVDLAIVAFPGISTVEKRHRVSVLRAADKLAGRLGWQKLTKPKSREVVYARAEPGSPVAYPAPSPLPSPLDEETAGRVAANLVEFLKPLMDKQSLRAICREIGRTTSSHLLARL